MPRLSLSRWISFVVLDSGCSRMISSDRVQWISHRIAAPSPRSRLHMHVATSHQGDSNSFTCSMQKSSMFAVTNLYMHQHEERQPYAAATSPWCRTSCGCRRPSLPSQHVTSHAALRAQPFRSHPGGL